MKQFKSILAILSLLCLVACAKPAEKNKTANSTQSSSTSSAMSQADEKDLTPEQVAESEGNHAEQVVVEITADGYVTSHGDHYHFYNGKVGYDALISSELLAPDGTQGEVVTDVADGQIIKVGEDYFLQLTTDNPQHLR